MLNHGTEPLKQNTIKQNVMRVYKINRPGLQFIIVETLGGVKDCVDMITDYLKDSEIGDEPVTIEVANMSKKQLEELGEIDE